MEKNVLLVYSAFFLGAILFSLLLNNLFLKFAKTLGMRNQPDTLIRWSSMSKPALGGISFYLLFLLSIAVYSIFFGDLLKNTQSLGLLGTCTLAFLTGLADDAYNTRPVLKFIAQILCAVILILSGIYIQFFQTEYLNYLLTILWVVGMMNSINMLDNMDAITASVSSVIIGGTMFILYLNGMQTSIYFLIMLGVLSSLLAFLFFNWHPSKMFMGDTGSQFLGAFLSAIGIIFLWNMPFNIEAKTQSKQLLIAILVFIIPIIDTTTVVINRLRNRKSPFVGGKDHTTHHLFYSGITEKRIAILFISLSLASTILATIIINFIDSWSHIHTTIFSIYLFILFGLLYYPTRIKRSHMSS